jgi:hypothetical protein
LEKRDTSVPFEIARQNWTAPIIITQSDKQTVSQIVRQLGEKKTSQDDGRQAHVHRAALAKELDMTVEIPSEELNNFSGVPDSRLPG